VRVSAKRQSKSGSDERFPSFGLRFQIDRMIDGYEGEKMLAKKYLKSGVLAGAALAAGLFVASPAHGKLVLTFSESNDPGSPHTVVGTTSAGLNSASISVPLTLPDFNVTIANGVSNEPSTSGLQGFLESQVLRITDTNPTPNTPVSITVSLIDSADPNNLSDIGYTIPGISGSTLELDSSLGGSFTKVNAAGTDTVTFQSFANGSVTGGPQSTNFTAVGAVSSFSLPNAPAVDFVRGAGYSLSNTVTITLNNSGDAFNISGTTTTTVIPTVGGGVPEPTTLTLGLLGACGLLLGRRKRTT
jgi:hypothetical protein